MQIYQKEFMIFANFEPLTAVIDSRYNAKSTSKLTSKRQRKEIE